MPSVQDILMGSRVAHVRELKAEIAKLKAENARLHDENASISAQFALALAAATDLRTLAPGAKQTVVDGWNLILGAEREARDRAELLAAARRHLSERPDDLVWIVFDGPRASTTVEGRLRMSYTGGACAHRADRFICDYLRMAAWLGLADRVEVKTHDRDFLREVRRICGR